MTLTADERTRANHFHFSRDKARFIVGRGALRAILSRYLQCEPAQLRFCYSAYGKPYLAPEFSFSHIHFNVSHSNQLGLIALTREQAVGVDIEYRNPAFASMAIAQQFFSAHEVAILQTLPSHQRAPAFYNCWTRKEAFIKAKGLGLSMPLRDFDVSLMPGEPARLLNVRGDPQVAQRWTIGELFPAPDYIAAVAVEGPCEQFECWALPDAFL